MNEVIAKSEAQILNNVIKKVDKKPQEDDEVVRILTTRSKAHLKLVFNHYKELYGENIHEVCNKMNKLLLLNFYSFSTNYLRPTKCDANTWIIGTNGPICVASLAFGLK